MTFFFQDWATDFALFESGVRVNPLNVKLRNNYGIELKSAGRVTEALHQYKVTTVNTTNESALL